MPIDTRRARTVAVAACTLIVTGCTLPPVLPSPWPTVATPENTWTATAAPQASDGATAFLDRLPVLAASELKDGYRRAEFGATWADTDRNGCNQRDDVLYRDADHAQPLTVARQGSCDHDVLAGTWRDAYGGRTLTFTDLKDAKQAQSIQIDHVVSLSDAWATGAWQWTPERRLDFANDLTNLVAVAGAINQSKSNAGPPEWLPDVDRCRYVEQYVRVKASYGLGVRSKSVDGLRALLAGC